MHHRARQRAEFQRAVICDFVGGGCGAGEVFGGGEQCVLSSDAGLDREQAQVAEVGVGAG